MVGVPKNTLSTWVKSKEKLFAALVKGNNVKRQKLRTVDHKTLDTAVFKWFLSLQSQNVPLSGAIIQEKVSQYAKEDDPFKHLQNEIDALRTV